MFITALLMAQPYELREPLPQIEVRSLTMTGFVVPVGWYGFIAAAGVGIVRLAMTETEAGMAALERLGAPDIESRSQAFDGRRLVRVNGGYIALNFMEYRDRDHTAAERSKRYRERQKAKENATRDDVDTTRDATPDAVTVTQADAEAELTASSHQPLSSFEHPDHHNAYVSIRAGATNRQSFDAMLTTLRTPISGGAPYKWATIGQALLEIHATGGKATPNSIRAFCRKLTQPEPQTNNGRPLTRTERGREALAQTLRRNGFANGQPADDQPVPRALSGVVSDHGVDGPDSGSVGGRAG